MSNLESWKFVIEFYENLMSEGFRFEPLLELCKFIETTEFAPQLYAFTSHLVLCISTVEDHFDQGNLPMITVQYSDTDKFDIKYWNRADRPGQAHKISPYRNHPTDTLLQLFPVLLQAT